MRWIQIRVGALALLLACMTGCEQVAPLDPGTTVPLSSGHLMADDLVAAEGIPDTVSTAPVLAAPSLQGPTDRYTVVVTDVPVRDLVFQLARDAGINADVDAGVEGRITMNAIDQTLPTILERLADQANLRYRLDDGYLVITPDVPVWRSYTVDYVNMSRDSETEVSVSTRIATTGGGVGEDDQQDSADQDGNASRTTVTNRSLNHFWDNLRDDLLAIVVDQRRRVPENAAETPPSVLINPGSGLVSVYATERQHRLVQAYVDRVSASAQRQVLIEMTIVEIELSDRFQAGIDWQRLSDNNGTAGNGPSIVGSLLGGNLSAPPFVSFGYVSPTRNISAMLRMLETFGDLHVLSSPKVMALNNQTAILKVVDEEVFFDIQQEIVEATNSSPQRTTFTSEIRTVPIGLVMSVTPQISESGTVAMSVRPTVTRLTGFATDPAPRLAGAGFDNLVPEIQIREFESLLQVADNQIVVLGGLMQNRLQRGRDGVPGLMRVPGIGNLFANQDNSLVKTELVVFIRPTVIKGGGSDGGLERFRRFLPPDGGGEEHRQAGADMWSLRQ